MADTASAPFYVLDGNKGGTFGQDKPLQLHIAGTVPREHIQDAGFDLLLAYQCAFGSGSFLIHVQAQPSYEFGGATALLPLSDLSAGLYQLISITTVVSEGGGNAVRLHLGGCNGQPLASFEVKGDTKTQPAGAETYPVMMLWGVS